MDQFSFHGPFAYRWINHVPVERIDLSSGERRAIEVIGTVLNSGAAAEGQEEPSGALVRAAMAAWN